jgi:hypothetical protein
MSSHPDRQHAASRRLELLCNLLAVPAFRDRVVNVEHENFETDTTAVREVEVKEWYDREADGWTSDLGVGPRFLETRCSLFVSQNESLFDLLTRRVSWPWWITLRGRESHPPLHWIDVFSFDQLDTVREKFQNWQHALFRGGPTNIGRLILTNRDPQFMSDTCDNL